MYLCQCMCWNINRLSDHVQTPPTTRRRLYTIILYGCLSLSIYLSIYICNVDIDIVGEAFFLVKQLFHSSSYYFSGMYSMCLYYLINHHPPPTPATATDFVIV